jgi:hypothetical protein
MREVVVMGKANGDDAELKLWRGLSGGDGWLDETGVDKSDRLERLEDVLVVRGPSRGGRLGDSGEVWLTFLWLTFPPVLSALGVGRELGDGCFKPVIGRKEGTMGCSKGLLRRIPLEAHELRSGKETNGSGNEPQRAKDTARATDPWLLPQENFLEMCSPEVLLPNGTESGWILANCSSKLKEKQLSSKIELARCMVEDFVRENGKILHLLLSKARKISGHDAI